MTHGSGKAELVEKALIHNLAPWWNTIELFAYLFGFCLVVMGIYRLAHSGTTAYGRSVGGGAFAGLMPVIFGSLMLALPTVMSAVTMSIFKAQAPTSALAYAPPASSSIETEIRFAVVILHLIGLYAVIKGLFLFSRAHEGGGEIGQALWHLVGGALALRVGLFMHVLGASTGGVFSSMISKLFPS